MDIAIQKLQKHTDTRGTIVEFLTLGDIKKNKGFGHLFFATFKDRKAIRGNHYHTKQHEFYGILAGKIKVVLKDIKSKKKKTLTLSSEGKYFSRLRIGPNIAHACYSISPTAVLLSYFKYPYDKRKPDATFHEVIKQKK